MNFQPLNNFIIAKIIVPEKQFANQSGFQYEVTNLPEYEIVSKSIEVKDYDIGDIIISRSTGTKLQDDLVMFDAENIAAKILNS